MVAQSAFGSFKFDSRIQLANKGSPIPETQTFDVCINIVHWGNKNNNFTSNRLNYRWDIDSIETGQYILRMFQFSWFINTTVYSNAGLCTSVVNKGTFTTNRGGIGTDTQRAEYYLHVMVTETLVQVTRNICGWEDDII